MDDESAMTVVKTLLGRYRGVDPSIISPATCLVDDLALDSLDATELLVSLHKTTGHKLQIDDFADIQTVGSIARILVEQSSVVQS